MPSFAPSTGLGQGPSLNISAEYLPKKNSVQLQRRSVPMLSATSSSPKTDFHRSNTSQTRLAPTYSPDIRSRFAIIKSCVNRKLGCQIAGNFQRRHTMYQSAGGFGNGAGRSMPSGATPDAPRPSTLKFHRTVILGLAPSPCEPIDESIH